MANEERDDESGEFASKYQDEDFLEAIDELGGAAGTSEIADEVGCPRRTAYHRLNSLENEGTVTSRKVGTAKLWELTND